MAKHKDGFKYLTTWDMIKDLFKTKKQIEKRGLGTKNDVMPKLEFEVNHIAVVLDNEVQEIIRAQNRLAALLLSEPKFIEFNPEEVRPEIGWNYLDGKFQAEE
jgi:hypothetical protein